MIRKENELEDILYIQSVYSMITMAIAPGGITVARVPKLKTVGKALVGPT
jgi:hypothetical protein